MRIWGVTQGCGLYGERDETRDHIFFACPYSFTVWEKLVRGFFGARTNPDCTETLRMVKGHRMQRLDAILINMVFQMTIHYARRERNGRLHRAN